MDAHALMEVQLETQTNVTAGKKAYSIAEFCFAHGISRATFYNLRKVGQAPKEMSVMGRRLISDEAAAQWRRQMEAA
jgi:predicted DNA-binding transcriptional regulator AlpA